MGTVTEVSLVWNKLQTGVINPRPLVLLGRCWKPVVKAWQENLVVTDADVSVLSFADSAEEACNIIQERSQNVIL
jgi:predicted Rossmann-fold nucleotide-binding protein